MASIYSRADVLKALASRRSLENPSTPLSAPDDWLYGAVGAVPSSSGINVSRVTALTFAAVWRAHNLIGDALGKCPLAIYRRMEAGGREVAKSHAGYRLLRRKPNEYTTAFQFKKLLQHHAMSNGNGYAFIERNGAAVPLALLPLNPDHTYPVREIGGRLWYVYDQGGRINKLKAEDVLHIHGLGFDGLQGYSVIAKARESLGLGMAALRFGSIFFRNGSSPHIALEVPGRMTKEARDNLRNSWERAHAGLDNAHKVALLEEGVKLQQYAVRAKDAQLLELIQASIRDVANWYGLPPHKLGDNARAAYNSLEQENQACLDECYDPWMCVWEEECHDKLLTEEEKASESHEVEFSRHRLVQPSLQTRVAYWDSGLRNGYLCNDEVREELGKNPLADGLGQRRFRQQNLAPLDQEPEEVGGEGKPGSGLDKLEEKSRRALLVANRMALRDAAGRMARRIGSHARRAAAQPAKFMDWLDTLPTVHQAICEEALEPGVRALGLLTHCQPSASAAAEALLGEVRETLLEAAGRAGPSELAAAVERSLASLERGESPQLESLFEE